MYADKTLVCRDCGKYFIFNAGEQEFYSDHGFDTEPSRCPECRRARKKRARREVFEAVCARCGNIARVGFEPRHDIPLYCRECYETIHLQKQG